MTRGVSAPKPCPSLAPYLRGLVGHHDALPAGDRVVHVLRKVVALHADEVAGGGRLSCRGGTPLQRGASRGLHPCAGRIAADSGLPGGLRPAGSPHAPGALGPAALLRAHLRAPAPKAPGRAGRTRDWGGGDAEPPCQPLASDLPPPGRRPRASPLLPGWGAGRWAQEGVGQGHSPSLKSRPSSWLGQRFTTSVTCSAFL